MPRVPHLPPSLLCVLLLTSAACAREGGGGDVRRDSAAVDSTAERTAAGAVPRLGALTPDSLDVDTLPDEVPGWRITRPFSFAGVRLTLPSAIREARRQTEGKTRSVTWEGFAPCPGGCTLTVSVDEAPRTTDLDELERALRQEAESVGDTAGLPRRVTLGGHTALYHGGLCSHCIGYGYVIPGDGRVARLTVYITGGGFPGEEEAAIPRFHRALDTFAWDTAAAASPAAPPPAP
jgi:hypothetical protein